MSIAKKVFWGNKWSSAFILLVVCASFVISYHIYWNSIWNLTEPAELAMSMSIPVVLFVLYLVFRFIVEGYSKANIDYETAVSEKNTSAIKQLVLSFIISLMTALFFLLIGFPIVDLITRLTSRVLPSIVALAGQILFLMLALIMIYKWIHSVVYSVKFRSDAVKRKTYTKAIFIYSILFWLSLILFIGFMDPFRSFRFLLWLG